MPLIDLLSFNENKELQAAATGAIWKCAVSPENAKELQKGDVISKLVGILTQQPEEVSLLRKRNLIIFLVQAFNKKHSRR